MKLRLNARDDMTRSTAFRDLRVAIVHDWLVTYGGAERVLEQLLVLFPQADLFSLYDFIPEGKRGFIRDKDVTTSFLKKLPMARKRYRDYLPLMPLAIEQFDLSTYDLVVSSSYAVAKGVITGPDQVHVSYVHSPIRYAWDLTHEYLQRTGLNRGLKSVIVRAILHYIRQWDVRTANGVDAFSANSHFIARRIEKVYRREAEVIPPPVAVEQFKLKEKKEDFYLTASRLVPYKRIDLIVQAFSQMPDKKLVVIGEGPEFEKIRALGGDNVQMLGYQPFDVLHEVMRKARGFVFAAEEDFGIIPVEAQACGTPVIAYGKGGALETVVADQTGQFFESQTVESLCDAIARFDSEHSHFDPVRIRAHAESFATEKFLDRFADFALKSMNEFSSYRSEMPISHSRERTCGEIHV